MGQVVSSGPLVAKKAGRLPTRGNSGFTVIRTVRVGPKGTNKHVAETIDIDVPTIATERTELSPALRVTPSILRPFPGPTWVRSMRPSVTPSSLTRSARLALPKT